MVQANRTQRSNRSRKPLLAVLVLVTILTCGLWPTFVAQATTENGLNTPSGIVLDKAGNFYISDSHNNRLLYFAAGDKTPSKVYGQPDFISNQPNSGGIAQHNFNDVSRVALDQQGGFYVSDYGNNRVLYYGPGDEKASRVYGQPDFNSNTPNNGGISGKSLNGPIGVALSADDSTLYVADMGNNRILVYDVKSGSTGAIDVYGQSSLNTNYRNYNNTGTPNSKGFYHPKALLLDKYGMYVTDALNNRVLYIDFAAHSATRVWGQPGFTTGTVNYGGLSAKSLNFPDGLALDSNSGGLFVADSGNNRVLYYPLTQTSATRVWGQPGFTSNLANNGGISDHSFYNPRGLWLDNDTSTLYVADYLNNRVLRFKGGNSNADMVYGQFGNFNTNSPSN
jgi:sugar lactone lactonase YvrE